jgi:hypothetical protein
MNEDQIETSQDRTLSDREASMICAGYMCWIEMTGVSRSPFFKATAPDTQFVESRASWPLIIASTIIVAVGVGLTISPLADALGFVPLPPLYWLYLVIILVGYAILTQIVKAWFVRRFDE